MRTLCVFIIALVCIPFAYAGETFYCSLESKASVEAQGGEVIGGQFVPGKEGNGFMSELGPDVIHFPFEGRLVNLNEGTIELWVKLGWDIDKFTDVTGKEEIFMFWSYNAAGTDAIGLMLGGGSNRPIAQMRIREAVGEWHSAVSGNIDPLVWKKDSIHHMAGTWGPDGVKLYLDGELAATNNFTGGPLNPIERFSINNNESDPARFPTMCVVDEMRIFDQQKSADEIMAPSAVSPEGAVATTWGTIKKMY